MYKIKIINGPNMNMLGIRETSIYGNLTYKDLIAYISDIFKEKNVELSFFQSNHEGDLVDEIQKCYFEKFDGIIINPAAYTHTSIAILDALKSVNIPTIEVHMSNVNNREDFRKKSYVESYCFDRVIGKGKDSYIEAINKLINYLENK